MLANSHDFEEIAALRWALCMEDAVSDTSLSRRDFIQTCVQTLSDWSRHEDTYHWIMRDADAIIAVMTVIAVTQLPSPERPHGQWGYLTNCYVKPEHRNSGHGSVLLKHVKDWCAEKEFEIVIVWPSDRAFSFYERSEFRSQPDPLCFSPVSQSQE